MKRLAKSAAAKSAGIPDVLVVGAGAFGGWTAFFLRLHGLSVTLIDAWGPGNPRASSGGETRILRAGYGEDEYYSIWAQRAVKMWRHWERVWERKLFHRTGVLWLAKGDRGWEEKIYRALGRLRIDVERLSLKELRRRYAQVSTEGLSFGVLEPGGGVLMAKRACQVVVEAFQENGGCLETGWVEPGDSRAAQLVTARLADGAEFRAKKFVFACGPWLGKVFPRLLGDRIRPTKQDVFFFGTPGENRSFTSPHLPVWLEFSQEIYGIPSIEDSGFKIASDQRGPSFDPTLGERVVSSTELAEAREFLEMRFPAMKNQPVVRTEVCQYEQTADGHFIIDRHPDLENVWFVGGGSGHGFKHGPIVGELLAGRVSGRLREAIPGRFRLSRT